MRFEFGIKPAKIITDYETGDVPDLKGPNESRPLDGPDGVWGNGVREKWDVTRKIHIVHSNPSPTTILATDLQPAPLSRVQVTAQAETFPSRSLVIVKRPAGDDANDDSGASDEANNPYLDTDRGVITDNSLNEIAFVKPGIGKIGSVDAPMLTFVRLLAGQADEELSWSASFEEYVRLEIAGKWYRISNFKPWTYSAKFKKINGTMEDNGSVSDPNP